MMNIYVTRFEKIHLITSEHNCSYRPFMSAKLFLSIFFLVQKKKYMTLLLYAHIQIAGELSKG